VYPAVYSRYTFEQWLEYLKAGGLVTISDQSVTISPAGRGAIPYMALHSYALDPAG